LIETVSHSSEEDNDKVKENNHFVLI